MYDWKAYAERIKWFEHDRFGMFIHWGLYSVLAKNEWIRSLERISTEEYQQTFALFDPVDYNPREWARLAKQAGMKYAVLTAKHHDGFCLFDSAYTDYKATNTKAGRDLVREYVEAFRAEGLKVGLYYSLLDWHHEDYPHYGDRIHPMRDNEAYQNKTHNFDAYIEYMHNQVRELCTNYGKIDLLWFDYSYEHMSGETWRATDLVRMVRSLQPGVLIDNRLEISTKSSRYDEDPKEYAGDFVSPEQLLPPHGMRNKKGEPVLWEACVTMNNHWCYCENDHMFKPASMIIHKMVECVSKGGNLLLNVGPDARGNIPLESVEVLTQVGKWLDKNAESIYGCGLSDLEKPDYGRVTMRKHSDGSKTYYFHITENTIGLLPLLGLTENVIKSVTLLASGTMLHSVNDFRTEHYNHVFVHVSDHPVLPDETDTVVKVEVKGS